MKFIENIKISLKDIPEAGALRNFSIKGDSGARFLLMVCDADGKYYDFTTNTFSVGHTPQKVLKETIQGSIFNGQILFPSVAGEFYDIILLADPSDDTVIKNKSAINKRINQLGNVTLEFALATTDHAANYASFPDNVTSTSNPAQSGTVTSKIDWTVSNVSDNTGGFGLVLNKPLLLLAKSLSNKAWYFTKQTTTAASSTSSTKIFLSSLTDIFVGMIIKSGTGLSGTPTITAIDTSDNSIEVSSAQTISGGVTLTFRLEGLSSINTALNCNITSKLNILKTAIVEKTVRGAQTNDTTIELDGTYGVPGGGIATYTGAGVSNASSNTVTSVSAHATQGSMVVSLAQTLADETKLKFKTVDSTKTLTNQFNITGNMRISKYPSSNRTIYLDLDGFVDPGTSS